uniref:Uncharacterized protein n=1 Tax=Phlebotomus papatasi TaxID=29031 RepID=A0A1B0DQL5_PHLPP
MWQFVLLVLSCGVFSVVSGIQVHEDVQEDTTTTTVLPLQVPNSQGTNLAGNSSAAAEQENNSSALRNQDNMRQNIEGNSGKNQDNTSQNNSSRFTHHIHIPDTNSQPSIQQFVPSPQLNTWNEKVTLSPEHNHFHPLRQGPQYKVLHAKVNPVSYKHTNIFMPPSAQKGHFVWVPYSAETTTVRNTELPPTAQNSWHWTSNQENRIGDTTATAGGFSYNDNMNLWQDYKKKPLRDWPYPFEVSDSPFTNTWTTEKAPMETTTLDFEDTQSKSKSHQPSIFSSKNKSPWKKLAHILTAAIPIGLLISALTPHVVYVSPNNT